MSEKAKVHAEGKEDNTTRPEDLEKLEGGPIEDRGCTDILCCLLFIAAQVNIEKKKRNFFFFFFFRK
jgi:hypothetical protein